MSKETSIPSKVAAPARSRIPYQLITIFSALTICIVIFGIFHFSHEEKLLIKENQNELSSINNLKALQIVNWRLERMSNAKAIFNIPLFSKYISGCARNPGDTKQLKEFLLTLETIKNVYRLESITAMDTRQNVICSYGKYAGIIDPNERKPIGESLKENKIIFSDMHRHDALQDIHLDIFIPVNLRATGKETRVGLIMLHIDPSEFLFPLVENWPLSSKTGETMLVTRQGDEVVFLTDLRYKKNAALNLKFSINTPDLPAALAAQGVERPVFGKDYRGENVLAALKMIPDSPWFLISKIDLKEIRAPIVFTEWLAAAAVIVFILFAGALTAFYWYKRDADYYRIQYALESEKKALEKHYSYLTRYANDIILLLNEETNFIEANEKACEVYGYTREELLKMKAEDIRAERFKAGVRNDIKKAVDTNGVIYETIHVRKDGAEFPVEVSLKLIEVEGVKYIQAIIRDITERKVLEQRMEAFFTESPAGLSIVDDQNRFVKINKKMADFNGYSVEAHIGKTIMELLPKLAPRLVPIHKEVIENGKSILNIEMSGETPGRPGQIRHWIASFFPVPGSDISRRYVGRIIVEVTDLKRAQEELRRESEQAKKRLDIAGVMFLVLDKEGRILMLNKKGVEITGHSESELFGKNWFDTFLPSDVKSNIKAVFHEAAGGNTPLSEHTENEIITKKGERRMIAFNNILLKDDKGYIAGVLSSGEDITDRRKAEEKVHKLNYELESRVKERTAQLEEANKYLESFSFSVSHDLRAPLRAIDGFSRILLEDHSNSLDPEAFRILNVVRKNTQEMGKLIDDLLRFSQVSRHELSVTEINMGEMVKSVIGEIEAANFGRKLNFIVHDLKGARGDVSVIKQVLLNLLSNAVKFTGGKETAVIEIGCKIEEKENTYYVKDNGVGFDMQYKDKLFGVFQRLHSEKEYGGTGIGLALVERIISRHGGKVRAEGKTGEGATFYFTLPA